MLGPLLARIVLVVYVAPFLLLVVATAYGIAASQLGEWAGFPAALATAFAFVMMLHVWLGELARAERSPR